MPFVDMPQDSLILKAYPAVVYGPRTRTLVYYRDLIRVLLAKVFKVRYKNTFMGYFWSVLQSLVLSLSFVAICFVVVPTPRPRAVPSWKSRSR